MTTATPKPAEKPAETASKTKSQAEIDKEAASAATAGNTAAPAGTASGGAKPAAAAANTADIPAPGEPGYTPPETVSDEEAAKLDAETGKTTSDNDEEHGSDDREYRGAAVRVTRLTDMLKTKKDEFIIYGYGGVAITLGDLRGLLSLYKD